MCNHFYKCGDDIVTQVKDLIRLHAWNFQVAFGVSVVAGPSPKVVALEAAQNLRATWVILDRLENKSFILNTSTIYIRACACVYVCVCVCEGAL